MENFTGIYFVQTTGFHGFMERALNIGGKRFEQVEGGYSFKEAEKINIDKIIALTVLFFITIPALIALAFCRLSLNSSQINHPIPTDDGIKFDEDYGPKEGGGARANEGGGAPANEAKLISKFRRDFVSLLSKVNHQTVYQKENEFNQVSEILKGLYLHGMSVNNWGKTKVQNTVVVQGRQNPAEYEWPPESHSGLQKANIHYFHRDLEKMDVIINLNKLDNPSLEDAKSIARNIIRSTEFTAFTVPSEDLEVSLVNASEEEIEKSLAEAILKHAFKGRPLKLIMNFDHGKEEAVEDVIRKAIQEDFLKGIQCAKDCTSSFFAGDEGKENIKRSIQFIVEKLLAKETVSIFCHQGKDRSAAIVFAALLYLSGDASKENQANVLQFLRTKRTIVSDYQKSSEKQNFINPMVAAVAEMLEEQGS